MARSARGMSYKQLASQMGVKKSTLENWEKGKTVPRANRLNQLAGVLNVPLLWLIAGSRQGTFWIRSPKATKPQASKAGSRERSDWSPSCPQSSLSCGQRPVSYSSESTRIKSGRA